MRLHIPCCFPTLVAITGALYLGIIGALGFDLVQALFGERPVAVRVVYALFGLAGVLALIAMARHAGRCPACSKASPVR